MQLFVFAKTVALICGEGKIRAKITVETKGRTEPFVAPLRRRIGSGKISGVR